MENAEKDLGVVLNSSQKVCNLMEVWHLVSSPVFGHSPNTYLRNPQVHCHGDVIANIAKLLGSMSSKLQEDFIKKLLLSHMQVEFGSEYKSFVPSDFVGLCCTALKTLYENSKQNIIYHLVRGLGTHRAESDAFLTVKLQKKQDFSSDIVNNLSAD